MTCLISRTIAIDPAAIEKYSDWLKLYPFVGQNKGLFLAKYPKKWINEIANNLKIATTVHIITDQHIAEEVDESIIG